MPASGPRPRTPSPCASSSPRACSPSSPPDFTAGRSASPDAPRPCASSPPRARRASRSTSSRWRLDAGVPRSIYPLEFLVSSVFIVGFRYAPDAVQGWRRERARLRAGNLSRAPHRRRGGGRRAARPGHPPERAVEVLPRRVRGRRRGEDRDLSRRPAGARRDRATSPSSSAPTASPPCSSRSPNLPAERVRRLLDLCASCKASFKIIPSSFTEMDARVSAAMLHDLVAGRPPAARERRLRRDRDPPLRRGADRARHGRGRHRSAARLPPARRARRAARSSSWT